MSIHTYNASDDELTRLAGGTLWADSPIGTILAYGGATAPSGWFICQGQEISRTTYSELFAVIGTSFGTGDGSTTFNLPDLREATTKGVGLTGKSNNHYDSDGVALGEFIEDRIKTHAHEVGVDQGSGTYLTPHYVQANNTMGLYACKAQGSATNEVKAVGVNYIIKAKMVAMPSDFMSKVAEANEYSTEETVVGKWIDGKPIYRVTFSISINGSGWIATGKTISNIDTIINATYTAVDPLSYKYNSQQSNCSVNASGELYMYPHINTITFTSITVEYTKTTD